MSRYRWPRTLKGWRTLFWLSLHRCPVHHCRIHRDPWSWGDSTRYCFKCDGIAMWPGGLLDALQQNARYEEHKVGSAKDGK